MPWIESTASIGGTGVSKIDLHHEGLLMAPPYASPRLLARHGLRYDDVHLWEIHEAFAAQVLAHIEALENPAFLRDKVGVDHRPSAPSRATASTHGRRGRGDRGDSHSPVARPATQAWVASVIWRLNSRLSKVRLRCLEAIAWIGFSAKGTVIR